MWLLRVELKIPRVLLNLLIVSLARRAGHEGAVGVDRVVRGGGRQVAPVAVPVRADSPVRFQVGRNQVPGSWGVGQRHLPDVSVVVSVPPDGLLILLPHGARVLVSDLLLLVEGLGVAGVHGAPGRGGPSPAARRKRTP